MIISLQVIRGLFNIRLARTLRWVDWLCGILPTTESHTAMSFPLPLPWNLTLHCSILLNLVSCLPWNLTLHCSIWLNGVLPAMESDSALFYLTQRCPVSVESDSALLYLTQWCPACRGIWICIVLFYSAVSCLWGIWLCIVLLDSAVSCLPWNLNLHCSIWLRGVLHTVESNSALLSLTQRCPACCEIWLCIVLFESAVSCLPWNLTLHCSIWLSGVLPEMKSDSALFYSNQRCPASVESDSALFYLTQRSSACRGIWLCIVLFDSAVFCLPWNLTLHCSILLRCLLLTSDFNSTASCTPQSLTPRCSWSRNPQYVMYMFSF